MQLFWATVHIVNFADNVRNGILNQSYKFEHGLMIGDTLYFAGQFLQNGEMVFILSGHGTEALRLTFTV